MATPPLGTALSDTYPNPSNATMRTGMGALWDYATTLLGATGTPADARTALGAAKSGANTDITSLGAVTGVTAPPADNSTKLATTAFVLANAPVVAAASETVAGKVELATGAEAIAGTDAVRAITPAGLRSGLNASGTAPVYACRAWVNFNGTGTVAIRASGNVSSITDNGVGDYTINFTTAMPDANYSGSGITVQTGFVSFITGTHLAGSIRITTANYNNVFFDTDHTEAQFFR